jgi:hypothetical protein
MEPSCAVLLAHWRLLRGDNPVTRVEDFLDRPSPAHAPYCFMAEIEGPDILLRLVGTALVARWGRDLTGGVLYRDQSPAFVAAVRENFAAVLAQPCGCYALNEYVSGRGRNVLVKVLYLPLASRPGRRPRIVGYSIETERRYETEPLGTRRRTVSAQWVDLGAGTPAAPPNLPRD